MEMWDFAEEATWPRMENRAAQDATGAVLDYWPYGQDEPNLDMPQDLRRWARYLTMEFLSATLGIPRWAIGSEAAHGLYLIVRNAYYTACLRRLEQMVMQRIHDTGKLPRQTLPPASSRTGTYPLPAHLRIRHDSPNSNEGA